MFYKLSKEFESKTFQDIALGVKQKKYSECEVSNCEKNVIKEYEYFIWRSQTFLGNICNIDRNEQKSVSITQSSE